MENARIEASATMEAGPAVVYGIIADYREGHPSILPPRYFTGLEVEEGGRGEGTIIRFGMRLGGVRESRARVTEPEPGRVLTETLLDGSGLVTTFTVDAAVGGGSLVTIATTWPVRGVTGWMQKVILPRVMRRIYVAELARLAEVAAGAGRAGDR